MIIRLPNVLYQLFPVITIVVGFFVALLIQNPPGIILALSMYIYSVRIMWMRL